MPGRVECSRYLHTCVLTRHACRGGVPQDKPTRKLPPRHQGGQDTYQEAQRGGVHHRQGYNWGRLQTTAETAKLHTLGCCPALLHCAELLTTLLLEAPPCWTENFICPAAHQLQRFCLVRCWWLPCPPCCLPDPWTEDSETQVHCPTINSLVWCYHSLH